MSKAISLLSGGLDSLLATIVVVKLGIDVTAVTFMTHFGCTAADTSSCSQDATSVAYSFGFTVKMCHLGAKFFDIVKNPQFGHGRNMNPCMDCRILMLKEARELMLAKGANFIVTGEVLGQRPMSQRRDTFPVIDRQADLTGLVLRPLSAKLLKPTIPEIQGIVERNRLYGFAGRSRKPQIALARELGLSDYPNPAGGCLLTDPIYSNRLKDLMTFKDSPDIADINLLRLGRHFRVSDDCKIIVGRDERDNEKILTYADNPDYLVTLVHHTGPVALIKGTAKERFIYDAASLCARYSKARYYASVVAAVYQGKIDLQNLVLYIEAEPAKEHSYESLMIKKSD
jgi:tRNA-specific 2-thiouridylase